MVNSRGFDISQKLRSEQLDNLLYLDTNTIIDLVANSSKHSKIQNSFYKNSIELSDVVFAYSNHSIEEARKVVKRSYIKHKFNQTDPKFFNTLNDSQCYQVVRFVDYNIELIEQFLEDDAYKIDYDSIRIESATRNIVSINPRVDYDDAKHLQIMRENNINSIFTQDQGFLNSVGFNVYGSSKKIVKDFRDNNHSSIISIDETNEIYE